MKAKASEWIILVFGVAIFLVLWRLHYLAYRDRFPDASPWTYWFSK